VLLHVRHSESALFKRYDVVMACDEVRGECGHVRHGSFDGLSAATTMEHYSGELREIPNREGAFHNPEMTMRFLTIEN